MSLSSDKFITYALTHSADIAQATSGRIFNPGREEEDENEDKIPYIIVAFEGMTNDGITKDDVEGYWDNDTISVLVVAQSREQLALLAEKVRTGIHDTYTDNTDLEEQMGWDFKVEEYTVSAGQVLLDPLKPCVYQTLTYVLTTHKL